MSNNSSRSGFALPAVLAVTGVVTLVFLVAITALASLTAEAGSARARVRFLQRAMTAEAMLSYLAATEPMSRVGFNLGGSRYEGQGEQAAVGATQTETRTPPGEIRLDGRPYELGQAADLLVTLQDQAGMINLAALSDAQWAKFAQLAGAPVATSRQLGPRYRDYTDTDDLVGPGGAEKSAYGAEAIANRTLRRPSEWLSLLGARAAVNPAAWRSIRREVATDHTLGSVNFNTANAAALQVLLDIPEDQARSILRTRQTMTFNDLTEFTTMTGKSPPGDTDGFFTFPTGRVIYTLRDVHSAWTYRARLTLTPNSLEQPLWIDQTELTEAPRRAVADISDATRFPYAPR